MKGIDLEKIKAVELVLGSRRVIKCPACGGNSCEICKGRKCLCLDIKCNGEPACLTCKGLGSIIDPEYRAACTLLGVSPYRHKKETILRAIRETYDTR